MDKIHDMQHHVCDANPAPAAEQGAPFHFHGIYVSCDLILVTVVWPIVKPLDHFAFLGCNEKREWCCAMTDLSKSWTDVTASAC